MTNKIVVLTIVVALSITLSACLQAQYPERVHSGQAKKIVSNLMYAQDGVTKQCYALVASRHAVEFTSNGFTITWVPCTPEVELQIKAYGTGSQ
jgi:hypothetical protein